MTAIFGAELNLKVLLPLDTGEIVAAAELLKLNIGGFGVLVIKLETELDLKAKLSAGFIGVADTIVDATSVIPHLLLTGTFRAEFEVVTDLLKLNVRLLIGGIFSESTSARVLGGVCILSMFSKFKFLTTLLPNSLATGVC